ncbi:MAG: hypothetical protein JW863_19280 [Chitinispirillaceae bacterium]|nr:hypothetical protein [Chitinispirillaceae bacterium]
MKTLRFIIVGLTVSSVILLTACSSATKLKYLNEPFTTTEMKIPLTLTEIEFTDNRADTSSRAVNIPRYTKLGQKDTVRQSLRQEHRTLLNEEMKAYFTGGGKEVKAVVEVIDGSKCFEAGRMTEIEFVRVRLGLTLLDEEHTPYFLKSSGEAMYEIKSLDAKNEFIEKLYQKALKAALYKCCEGITGTLQQVQ